MQHKWYIAFSLFFATIIGKAQDVHFSQIFAQPLLTNPANTGNLNGNWRIGLNYRDQWGSVTIPYRTYDIYSDISVQPKGATNRFGIGLILLNDVAGNGNLSTTKVYLSAAYHIGYDDASTYRFSFGLQGGWVQKKVDINKLTFDSQWDEDQFNTALPNNEIGANGNIHYLDFSAGALFTILPYDDVRYFFGTTLAHLTQPDESFYGTTNQLGIRINVVSGAYLRLNNKLRLQPQVFFQTQKKAVEIIAGANIIFPISTYNESYKSVFLGAWYRYADAGWLVAGMSFGNLTFSASYDINISKLSPASNALGGLEIGLVYSMNRLTKKDPMKCPGFE